MTRHNVVVAKEGVFVWGANMEGQLGLGDTTHRLSPTLLPDFPSSSILSIFCGFAQTLAITKEGEVYGWGSNKFGELGFHPQTQPHYLVTSPKHVTALTGKKIRSIVGGFNFTMGLAEDGKIYSWGSSDCEALGRLTAEISEPEEITGFPGNLISVASGHRHALALDEEGNLWAWGQLFIPGPIAYNKAPKKIQLPEEVKFTSIGCGSYFSGALSKDGELYFWGSPKCHRLSLEFIHLTPTKLILPGIIPGEKIISFACGYYFFMLQTTNENIYTQGHNIYGQLGVGHSEKVHNPVLVNTKFGKISGYTCGAIHSLIFTNSGDIFSSGCNGHGQLGFGDNKNRKEFEMIQRNFSPKIVAVGELNFSEISEFLFRLMYFGMKLHFFFWVHWTRVPFFSEFRRKSPSIASPCCGVTEKCRIGDNPWAGTGFCSREEIKIILKPDLKRKGDLFLHGNPCQLSRIFVISGVSENYITFISTREINLEIHNTPFKEANLHHFQKWWSNCSGF
jgi:alpha-tubulin suppressor-like RCC1 family protein